MIQGTDAMDRAVTGKTGSVRRLLLGAAIVVGLAAAAAAYPALSRWFTAERSVELSRLRLGTAVVGDLERDLAVQGRTVAAFHPTAFSPAGGIVSLAVGEGDVVDEGHVLARVDSPELENRLEQARSTLASLAADLERQRILSRRAVLSSRQQVDLAGVELEAARRAMRRADQSRADGILNDVDHEKARDDLARAELKLDHAREDAVLEKETLEFEMRDRELEVARQRLIIDDLVRQVDDLTIRAPVAGLVSRIDVDDRDAVRADQPLVTVVDLSAFEIEILIPEAYADEVGPGTPAVVLLDGGSHPARVKSVAPEVEGSQVQGMVTFTAETPAGLRQNQRVSTRLILESRKDVIKVPRGPFLDAGGGTRVYVVDGDLARARPVEVGAVSVSEVEVLSGLVPGDKIILSDTARFEGAGRVYLRR